MMEGMVMSAGAYAYVRFWLAQNHIYVCWEWRAESEAVTGPDCEIDGATGIEQEMDLAQLIELEDHWGSGRS